MTTPTLSLRRWWSFAYFALAFSLVALPGTAWAICGDANVEAGEGCDDGGRTSDDGCDMDCAIEFGWQCAGSPSACTLIGTCGDSVIEGSEECDDGNTTAGDGCDDACKAEFCGDGVINNVTETCDDMNEDQGCVACQVQPGWACTQVFDPDGLLTPSQCISTCGDGIKASDEECDDNNLTNDDGCSEFCMLEGCGNGFMETGEGCDDGNASAGDGCTATCTVEAGWVCDSAGCIPITACDATALKVQVEGTATFRSSYHPFDDDRDADGDMIPDIVGWDWIYVYRDIPAFTIDPGDTFALDALSVSAIDVIAQIELAPAMTNGSGAGQPAAAFTTVVSTSAATSRGNTVPFDHDLEFTATGSYTHPGGGLLLRIRPSQGDLLVMKTLYEKYENVPGPAIVGWRDGDGAYPWDTEFDKFYALSFAIWATPPACLKAGYDRAYTIGGDCDSGTSTCTPEANPCQGIDRNCGTRPTTCVDCATKKRWNYFVSPCCDAGTGASCMCHKLLYSDLYCNVRPETAEQACTVPYNLVKEWKTGCTSCDDSDICTTDSCSAGTCSSAAAGSGACYTGPAATRGVGQCQDGLSTCPGGSCVGEVLPSTDVCDGVDNDCNGTIDDVASADASCDDADASTTDSCVSGTCQNLPGGACTQTDTDCGPGPCQDCNAQDGWYTAGPDVDCCDGMGSTCTCTPTEQRDYFCNAGICDFTVLASDNTLSACTLCDDANVCTDDICNAGTGLCEYPNNTFAGACYTGPVGTEGVGTCVGGMATCSAGVLSACSDVTPVAELCDNLDNDCDGVIDNGADASCGAGNACIWGNCYASCTVSTDCAGGESCYSNHYRCDGPDPCASVTCPAGLVCAKGNCYEGCVDDGDCTPPLVCFNGRCAETACDGVQCPVEDICHLGECYTPCSGSADCAGEACQLYETCSDSSCDNYCSDNPCAGVECQAGPPAEVCHLGNCYPPCLDDGDCTPPLVCFEGVCVDPASPCDGMHCPEGTACYLGECYDACEYDAECAPVDEMCFQGSCVSTVCSSDTCPGAQVCHLGVCYDACVSDGDCTPPNLCFDGVCAANACEALIEPANYPYHVNHVYTRTGRWMTARQSSIPKVYPMPVETTDPAGWATGTSPASQAQKARVVLFFDETAADTANPQGRYVLWLTQGATDAAQGPGRASYSIRWEQGIDGAGLTVTPQDATRAAVGATLGTPPFHQIQLENAAGAANGVRIGYLPASTDTTIRIDADFSGDISGWELYNGDTGWFVPLNANEPLTLRVQPAGDPAALLTPELGSTCVPNDPNALGVCSRGSLDRCRNGELFCLASVTPWAYEGCDGVDNNCNGYLDEASNMQLTAAYVRQSGNAPLENWVPVTTDDRASSVIDALNFVVAGGDGRAGRSDYLYPDGSVLQVFDGVRTFFHRNLLTGSVTMPILAGSNEASVAVRDIPVKVDVDTSLDFGAYGPFSHQMHLIWWDERAEVGPLKAGVAPAQVEPELLRTESELRWRELGTASTDPAQADADALVWRSALKHAGSYGSVSFSVDVTSALSDVAIATTDGSILALNAGRFEVKLVAVPIAEATCYDAGETGACKYGGYVCAGGALSCEITAGGCACQDADGDGFLGHHPFTCPTGTDCDDTNAMAFPGGVEVCDGFDNNCDGAKDGIRRPLDPNAATACPPETLPGEDCGPIDCNYRDLCSCPNGPELPGDPEDKCFCSIGLTP